MKPVEADVVDRIHGSFGGSVHLVDRHRFSSMTPEREILSTVLVLGVPAGGI